MTPALLALLAGYTSLIFLSINIWNLASHNQSGSIAKSSYSLRQVWTWAPLALSLWALYDPDAILALWGWTADHQHLSFTVKYEDLKQGVGVFKAPLYWSHELSAYISYSLLALSAVALIATWSNLEKLARFCLFGWVAVLLYWWNDLPVTLYQSLQGESAIKAYLQYSTLDIQRVVAFVPPKESWYFSTQMPLLNALAIVSAIIGFLIPSKDYTSKALMQNFESWGRISLGLTTIVALGAALWSLQIYGAFYASPTQYALWIATFVMSVAAIFTHHAVQALWLCMMAVIVLSVHTLI